MSQTVASRRIRATPHRLSSETWAVITNLLVPQQDKTVLDEFVAVGGIGASMIEKEALKDSALVVWGAGLRVRLYCLYGDDAVTGEDANESALPESPTDGDWHLSLPVHEEDLAWIRKSLAAKGVKRISVREKSEDAPAEADNKQSKPARSSLQINEEAFRRL